MAPQLDEALAALRALVDAARGTYGDYVEDVWGPRDDLRQAVAMAAQVLGEALCAACKGLGYDGYRGCEACHGDSWRYGDGLARPAL